MPSGSVASPPRSSGPRRGTGVLIPLLVFALFAAACGAEDADNLDGTTAPTDRVQVADARFDGEFQITEVVLAGQTVPLLSGPIVSIETVFGGLSLMPGCNTYFGSFTLAESGEASFTVAGGSGQSCEDLAQQEQAILDALGSVTAWEQTDDGFRFTGDGDNQLRISR